MPAEVVKNTMQGKRYDLVINTASEEVIRAYGIKIANQARALAPRDTGRLRASITYQTKNFASAKGGGARQGDIISKPRDKYTCYVGTNVDYAPAIEFGSRPHTITAKKANVLTDGKKFFGKTVNHPGYQGMPFLRPAFDIVKRGATAAAALEIRKAMINENRKSLSR